MAVLKKIKFGNSENPIQFTEVKPASGGVITATGAHTELTDGDNPEYVVDLTIADDGTLVKDNGALKVGTVPAAQVSVAAIQGIDATNAQAAFQELKGEIDAVGGAAKSYKIVAVDEPASTSQAEYKIQEKIGDGSWGDVTGSSPIVVPKDNAFVTAQLGHVGATAGSDGTITDGDGEDALLIEYVNGSGVYTLVAVPIGAFLKESEFKDGLEVSANGEVSAKLGQGLEFGGETGENQSIKVKVDSTSEKDSQTTPADFLTVSANGIKVQGIGAEIDRKIAALDVTNDTTDPGKYVASIQETDGIVSVKERLNVSEAVLNNYAKGSTKGSIAATDTINQAFSKIEVTIEKVDTDLTAEETRAKSAETAIDGAVGLTKDASGEGRTYTNTGEYIGKETSNTVASDIKALDTQLKAVTDKVNAIQYKVTGTTLEFFEISEKTGA